MISLNIIWLNGKRFVGLKNTSFWNDVWIDLCSFKIRFEKLFKVCSDPDISVSNCWVNESWNVDFVRNFGAGEKLQ